MTRSKYSKPQTELHPQGHWNTHTTVSQTQSYRKHKGQKLTVSNSPVQQNKKENSFLFLVSTPRVAHFVPPCCCHHPSREKMTGNSIHSQKAGHVLTPTQAPNSSIRHHTFVGVCTQACKCVQRPWPTLSVTFLGESTFFLRAVFPGPGTLESRSSCYCSRHFINLGFTKTTFTEDWRPKDYPSLH